MRPSRRTAAFSWKAVLVGAGTDLGCSAVSGIVIFMFFSWWLSSDAENVADRLEKLAAHWPFMLISMLVGASFTVLGGYVAARMAGHAFLKHALAAGAVSLGARHYSVPSGYAVPMPA